MRAAMRRAEEAGGRVGRADPGGCGRAAMRRAEEAGPDLSEDRLAR